MSLANLLSQFTNSLSNQTSGGANAGNPIAGITDALPNIPKGFAGGAAAGGIVALLMSSKSARNLAGSAVTIGGTALLGGLAYKAFTNWQENKPLNQTGAATAEDIDRAQTAIPELTASDQPLKLTLVKAMISAAKSDGHIDPTEQKSIFDAVEKLELTMEDKAAVFDAMSREIPVAEIAGAVQSYEHKAEVYLSAYLAIDVDNEKERDYLGSLASALELPPGLSDYLEQQAQEGFQQQ